MRGTLVNVVAVLLGSGLGLLIGNRLPEKIKKVITTGLGLSVILIGMQMAFKTNNVLIIIGSLVFGGILGELLQIEEALEALGERLKAGLRFQSGGFVEGFVTASLVYCVGAMTVVGSIQEGLSGDPQILYAKSLLDGTASIAFASTLGIGVAFASLTVFFVQGSLTLLGKQLSFLLSPGILSELTATGGLLILAIGLYLLEIKRIKVANLLPALIFAVVLAAIFK